MNIAKKTNLYLAKLYVHYPLVSWLVPTLFMAILFAIRASQVDEEGLLGKTFPEVHFHTRWDFSWQLASHQGVRDWAKFSAVQEMYDEMVEE